MTELIKFFDLQLFNDEVAEDVETTVEEGKDNGKSAEPFAVFPDQESFKKRLSREAKKLFDDTLSGLGVKSLDDLKTFIEDKKAKEEAEKSELQKAQELIQQLTQERDGYIRQEQERKRTEVATTKAMELGVKPERVARLLRLVDMDSITTDGKIDEEALVEEMQRTLEEFPEFKQVKIEAKAGTDFNDAGKTGAKPTLTMDMIKRMSASEIAERIDEVRAVMSAK